MGKTQSVSGRIKTSFNAAPCFPQSIIICWFEVAFFFFLILSPVESFLSRSSDSQPFEKFHVKILDLIWTTTCKCLFVSYIFLIQNDNNTHYRFNSTSPLRRRVAARLQTWQASTVNEGRAALMKTGDGFLGCQGNSGVIDSPPWAPILLPSPVLLLPLSLPRSRTPLSANRNAAWRTGYGVFDQA